MSKIINIEGLDTLRLLMISEKGFLSRLYNGNSMENKCELAAANSVQVKVLIELLHYLSNGNPKTSFFLSIKLQPSTTNIITKSL